MNCSERVKAIVPTQEIYIGYVSIKIFKKGQLLYNKIIHDFELIHLSRERIISSNVPFDSRGRGFSRLFLKFTSRAMHFSYRSRTFLHARCFILYTTVPDLGLLNIFNPY